MATESVNGRKIGVTIIGAVSSALIIGIFAQAWATYLEVRSTHETLVRLQLAREQDAKDAALSIEVLRKQLAQLEGQLTDVQNRVGGVKDRGSGKVGVYHE